MQTPLLSGEQVVRLVEAAPAILMACASLILAIKAERAASKARDVAYAAHEAAREAPARASAAAREQVDFALSRRGTRRGSSPPRPHAVD